MPSYYDPDDIAKFITEDPDKFVGVSEGANLNVTADATDAFSSLGKMMHDPEAYAARRADDLELKKFEADQAAGRFDYNSNEAQNARRELTSDRNVSSPGRKKHTMKEIRFLELQGYGKTDIPWDAEDTAEDKEARKAEYAEANKPPETYWQRKQRENASVASANSDELDESDISYVADMLTDDPDKFIEPTSEGVEEGTRRKSNQTYERQL